MWSIPKITERFEEKMMDVLEQYEEEYNPQEPRVNIDEKSTQLLNTPRGCRPTRPGKAKREDYEYKRNGTANIFVCIEPKTGRRHLRVTARRTGKDFAKYIRYIVMKMYKEAKTVHITIDNLNTHTDKAITDYYGEDTGRAICNKIQWHYTPTHASWLNAAEIEISVLRKQVLKQRIESRDKLKRQVRAYQVRRNKKRTKINWQFSRKDAKKVFSLH